MANPYKGRRGKKARQGNMNSKQKNATQSNIPAAADQMVDSLFDAMVDGQELGSIIDKKPKNPLIIEDFRRALGNFEEARGRPCLVYISDIITQKGGIENSINPSDHLPFLEMVQTISNDEKRVDIFLATPGGNAETVLQFVNALRPRFDEVDFFIPYKSMSAGTLWALSGNKIWMDQRGYLGPIDPQIQTSTGRFIPAQSVLQFLELVEHVGQKAVAEQKPIPWSWVTLLKNMDQASIGAAYTSSKYAAGLATDFLEKYKFSSWLQHSTTGAPVTAEEKHKRAEEVANKLSSHALWKAHGHTISREIANNQLQLKIHEPESEAGVESAMHKLWAYCYYLFDKSSIVKMILSQDYGFVRSLAKKEDANG